MNKSEKRGYDKAQLELNDMTAENFREIAAYIEIEALIPEAETLARVFHEQYERLALEFGYKTRKASATSWKQVPECNKKLMTATARAVIGHFFHKRGSLKN